MKKQLLGLFFLILGITAMSQERHYDVTFQPLELYSNSGVIGVSFQEGSNAIVATYGTPIHRSVIGKTFGGFYLNPVDFNELNMYTRIISVGFRRYLIKTSGVYCEGTIKSQTAVFDGSMLQIKGDRFTGSFYNTSLGTELGYQWVISNRFVIDVFAGVEGLRTNARVEVYTKNNVDAVYVESRIRNTTKNNLPNRSLDKLIINKGDGFVSADIWGYYRIMPFAGFKVGLRIN